MCIGRWVQVLDFGVDMLIAGEGELTHRLAAALHGLADEREKVTT